MKNKILLAVFCGFVGSLLGHGAACAALKIEEKRVDREIDDFQERIQHIIDEWPAGRFTDEQKEVLRSLGYTI